MGNVQDETNGYKLLIMELRLRNVCRKYKH